MLLQSLALDPRYSSRKSHEVAVVTACGSVLLSSQGWLGRSDTPVYKGTGAQLVRWWGHLVTWITQDTLMVGLGGFVRSTCERYVFACFWTAVVGGRQAAYPSDVAVLLLFSCSKH